MKVGGNESATKFFRSNGGTAALNSKDPKTKYHSATATKYKEEIKRRVERDREEFPDECVITENIEGDDSSTPAGETEDDFFSSWDKPAIKKPTPPISRTGTPPVAGRTPSPFLSAGSKDNNRSTSPLSKVDSVSEPKPSGPSRIVHSSALRKSAVSGGPRKANVLGAKKATSKLGAKKVTADIVDFDEAEKKAKEEAERIEKLGYDPEAEEAEISRATAKASSAIVAPTPVTPAPRSAGHQREKSASEMERLGMGMGRLGFGQIGNSKPAVSAKKAGTGGFGSVGPIKAATEDDDERYARNKFGTQKAISSDEFFGKGAFDPSAQSEAKTRLQGFEGATSISSNAYFGRPEDEGPGGSGSRGVGSLDDYGDLETAAKDFIRKWGITASDDLENLTSALGEGATKLQGAIRNYLGN